MRIISNKRKLLIELLWVLALGIGIAAPVQADFTVQLLDSNCNGLAGGVLSYYSGGGTWTIVGTTGSDGTVSGFVPGTLIDFMLKYYSGTVYEKNVDVTTNPTLTFQTELVIMKLLSSTGNELSGGALFYSSGWKPFGSGTTTTTMELLPTTNLGSGVGSYDFRVTYAYHTSSTLRQDIDSDPVVTFDTTNVTFSFPGSILYYGTGGWKTFTGPSMELLPGLYDFKFDGYLWQTEIFGSSFAKGIQIVDGQLLIQDISIIPAPGAFLLGGIGLAFSSWKLHRRRKHELS